MKSVNPFDSPIPKAYETTLSLFQKLLLLKCLKPERLIYAIDSYIKLSLGESFADLEEDKLEEIIEISDP